MPHTYMESACRKRPVCNSAAALVYLANQDCIVFHTWQSRLPALDKPDRLIFDLDPPGGDFSLVRAGALALVLGASASMAQAIEEPAYTVLREYPGSVRARSRMASSAG